MRGEVQAKGSGYFLMTREITRGPVSTRVTAIVEAAVFDAVNGIERRYTPIHVDFAAPAGASKRAAAIQALGTLETAARSG